MAREPQNTPPDPADPSQQRAERTAVTAWDAVDPVPALRVCRDELVSLAAQGQPGTGSLTDHLAEVIAGLEDVGVAMHDGSATPDDLRVLLERCSSDLEGARALVAESRRAVRHRAGAREDGAPTDVVHLSDARQRPTRGRDRRG